MYSMLLGPEKPSIKFSELIDRYLKDVTIRLGIDHLAEATSGMGYYTTCETEVVEKKPGVQPKTISLTSRDGKTAKDVVDDFAETWNLDEINITVARELWGFGNSIYEKLGDKISDGLAWLNLALIKGVNLEKDAQGFVRTPEKIESIAQEAGGPVPADKVMFFRWNRIGCSSFGYGLLHTLSAEGKGFLVRLQGGDQREKRRPSILEIKERAEDDSWHILHRYRPRFAYVFEGASDEYIEEVTTGLKDLEDTDDFATNKKLELVRAAIDARAPYGDLLTYFENRAIEGVQSPIIKLFTTPGFTEASARAAVEVSDRKVLAMQRYLKRRIEREIYAPLCKDAGIDPLLAKPRLNWGSPDMPEVKAEHVIELAKLSAETGVPIIRVEEIRKMLTKMGFELWEPEPTEEEEQPVMEKRRRK